MPIAHTGTAEKQADPTFGDDRAFLEKHGPLIELQGEGGSHVLVSPTWQGRVMTSAVAVDARSLGFVHRAFIVKGQTGTAFDNYGGEDRFWLGPEGTKFSLYFAPGAPLDFDHWQTPKAFNEGAWQVVSQSKTKVALAQKMTVGNHAGTTFSVAAERTIELLDRAAAKATLGIEVPADVKLVAFSSTNAITNAGTAAWTKETGLPSVWILGMYAPSKDTSTIVPFDTEATGPIVRDDYFGKVPADRLAVRDRYVVFRCDGELRSKIGLPPARAKTVLGSYSASAKLLTIVHYDRVPANTTPPPLYPSGVWDLAADPFAGDIVNAYNDGPVAPGKPSLGGFYELETSSPGAALAPGAKLVHVHRTFHFVGEREALENIARAVLSAPLP